MQNAALKGARDVALQALCTADDAGNLAVAAAWNAAHTHMIGRAYESEEDSGYESDGDN